MASTPASADSSAFSSGSVLCLSVGVLVPHVALAKYYFGLTLVEVPEPLLSLLVLAVLSAAILFVVRPAVLDLVVPRSRTSTARPQAEWVWANVQYGSFFAIWLVVIAQKFVGQRVDVVDAVLWMSVLFGVIIWVVINLVCDNVFDNHPASAYQQRQVAQAKRRAETDAAKAAAASAASTAVVEQPSTVQA